MTTAGDRQISDNAWLQRIEVSVRTRNPDGSIDEKIINVPIAISHEGIKGDDNVITRAGFQRARSLDFRYFETDIRLLADGSLVALHEVFGDLEPEDERRARAAGGLPTVRELLDMPDTFWNFELKGDDGTAATMLARELTTEDMHRVLISFGTNVDSDAVTAIRAALPRDTCFAASVRERSIDWDAWPDSWADDVNERVRVTQVWHEHIPGSQLLFVSDVDVRQADERRLALHVYALSNDTPTRRDINDLAEMGVAGLMVDHHEEVRDIYVKSGYPWPSLPAAHGVAPPTWPTQDIDPERDAHPVQPTIG